MNNLAVKLTENMGRGVFAQRAYKKDELVESSPVLVIESDEISLITTTVLNMYVFEWAHGCVALALGMGSLFNHAWEYNLTYKADQPNGVLNFYATRDIQEGEQLFITYGYEPSRGLEIYKLAKDKRMPVQMPKKRDVFIDKAVDLLQTFAKESGFGRISKETLSFIIQRYIQKYNPPRLPALKKLLKSLKLEK